MRRIFSEKQNAPGFVATLLALLLLHVVLLLPNYPDNIVPAAFAYLPLELPILILLFALPLGGFGFILRAVIALALTLFTAVKVANIATFLGFNRAFNPVVDPSLIPIAIDTLSMTSKGLVAAAVTGTVVLIAALIMLFFWASRVFARPSMLVLGGILLTTAIGFKFSPWRDYSVADASRFSRDQIANVGLSLAAAEQFKRDVAADPFRDIPGERLLTRLKGNDVLLIFVEAYGRTAFDAEAPVRQLHDSEAALRAAGYAMRSSWLVSPTFGGASWLAHSTFVTGLPIEDHQRYNTLFVSGYKTLIHDFARAGWRTSAVMPLFTRPWPEGSFFGFDAVYTANNLGYAGPPFGYITMPDQYVLSAFQKRELDVPGRKPVMTEMALNSSHLPWTPRPHFLPWEAVGDGSAFATEREGEDVDIDWLAPQKMRNQYELAITYAIKTVFSFAETQVKEPALIIILGDHQPVSLVSGTGASHDVPVHILARDPTLLDSFTGWKDGLVPDAQSPVWKMDAMRGHILKAFSAEP
ncbi:MAG: sulfatase-like hydrolase/transferase [Rhodospirillaceae bacterium]